MIQVSGGRALVRSTLRGRTPPRPPLIPFVHSLAARLAQISTRAMAHDPTLMANSLAQAQALFGYDAITVGFDETVAAEACGCKVEWAEDRPQVCSHLWKEANVPEAHAVAQRGRVPVVVEVVRRLRSILGETAALIGVVQGPWTLACHLYGPDFSRDWAGDAPDPADCLVLASRVGVTIARLFGEARVDALLVMESSRLPGTAVARSGDRPQQLNALRGTYRPLWNVARFYNAPGILVLREHQPAGLAELTALGATALALGQVGHAADEAWPNARVVPGRAISAAALAGSPTTVAAAIDKVASSAPASPWFLTTEWEVPTDTPPENLHAAVAAVRAFDSR